MGSLLKSLGYTAKDVVDAADKLIINLAQKSSNRNPDADARISPRRPRPYQCVVCR
jgi:hypothetical protein